MRAGSISDEMWDMYTSRILTPDDARLTDPSSPFARHDICFVVHRHRIRDMHSFRNAADASRKLKVPLYVLQAKDEPVRHEDKSKFTESIKGELLRRVNPEHNKGLPSFLPLYCDMKLLLTSKDCVRFGIVKGCPCILRDIIFAEDEVLPYDCVAGQPHQLKYMPTSLLLQAENASWTLPATELPAGLPSDIDRRGLFQLRPCCDYFRICVDNEYISVRRTSIRALPADTITVYAAQGGTYDAVVADMQRPPHLELSKHWLACYVMLSRARSLDGFLILRPATRKELSARPPQYLLDELHRLEQWETSSLAELFSHIKSWPMQVPPKT